LEVPAVSAGILLLRRRGDSVELLLIHPGGPYWARRDRGAWSIPKGQVEAGEDPRDCALRELAEELGPAVEIDRESLAELGSVRQRGGKTVHCWAAAGEFDPADMDSNTFSMEWPPRSGRQAEFPEADRAEWFSPAAARRKILAAQVPLIERALEL
jgi:predicted NUDIX family NTP pyrophosphohydrolase